MWCAVFNATGVCDKAQGIMEEPKPLSWWWPVYCSYQLNIEGFLRGKKIRGLRELPFILCMVRCPEAGSLNDCIVGKMGIRVWFFLIYTTLSQFLGDIAEYNHFIFPLSVSSILQLVTSLAAVAQSDKV